ncbi:DNase I-like protein [Meredithblackwellia eburnea MCA 4105]
MAISGTGRYVWAGTLKGALFEVDVKTWKRTATRKDVHQSAIIGIFRLSDYMYTLDESGRLVIWLPDPDSENLCSLHGPCKILQIPRNPTWVQEIDKKVWAFYENPSHSKESPSRGGPGVLRVVDVHPKTSTRDKINVTSWTADVSRTDPFVFGKVMCGTAVPSQPDLVYLGHESGHVSIWNREEVKLVRVQKVSVEKITAMCGPARFLWVGFDTGFISIFDISGEWKVLKRWRAHKSRVVRLFLDVDSIWTASTLRVVSAGEDLFIQFWDGFLRADWISSTLRTREPDFSTYRNLNISIFSWNVDGQCPKKLQDGNPSNENLLAHFLQSLDEPDVIHFGFQELIDLSNKTLAARTILFASDVHDVTGRYREWRRLLKAEVLKHLGPDYVIVAHKHLVGIASDLFMRRSIAARARDVDIATVKTGFFDQRYGNKGSVMIRFVLDDSSVCFINSHLASGQKRPAERTRDIIEILEQKSHFSLPGSSTRHAYVSRGDGTQVADHEMTFFSGDLNFRVDLPRSTVIRAVKANKLDFLLEHDQLELEMQNNQSFRLRAFLEPPICFAPTYKYDHHSTEYDTSKKQRVPSWCDRILYRAQPTSKIVPLSYLRYEADISDHRPISGAFVVKIKTIKNDARNKVWRQVVRDWSSVEDKLLEMARNYYPIVVT